VVRDSRRSAPSSPAQAARPPSSDARDGGPARPQPLPAPMRPRGVPSAPGVGSWLAAFQSGGLHRAMRGQGGCTHLVSHGASRLAQRCRPDAARRRVCGCTRRCARLHGLFTRDLLLGGRELWLLAQGDQVGGVDLANSTLGAAGSPQKHVDLSAPRNHRANLPLQRRRAAGVANPNPSAVGQHRHRRLLDTLSAAPVTAFAVNRLIIRLVLSHVERGQTGQKATTRTERRSAATQRALLVNLALY